MPEDQRYVILGFAFLIGTCDIVFESIVRRLRIKEPLQVG